MDIYLNVDFSGQVDKGLLSILSQELTFDGIRVPIRDGLDVGELLTSCTQVGLKVILLIPDEDDEGVDTLFDQVSELTTTVYENEFILANLAIELINEPLIFNDHWKFNPQQLGLAFNKCVNIIREKLKTVTILTPSIPNLGTRDLVYLSQMFNTIDLTQAFSVAVHRYPAYLNDFQSAHMEFGQRSGEIEGLKTIMGSREFWVTETGCSQNYRQKKLCKDKIININEE